MHVEPFIEELPEAAELVVGFFGGDCPRQGFFLAWKRALPDASDLNAAVMNHLVCI